MYLFHYYCIFKCNFPVIRLFGHDNVILVQHYNLDTSSGPGVVETIHGVLNMVRFNGNIQDSNNVLYVIKNNNDYENFVKCIQNKYTCLL